MKGVATAVAGAMPVIASVGCGGLAQSADIRETDIKAIRDDLRKWKADRGGKDIDKPISHYDDEAIVMAQGIPAARTRDARHSAIKDLVSDPQFSQPRLDCPRIEVAKSGDLGYAQCSYVATMTDPNTKKPFND